MYITNEYLTPGSVVWARRRVYYDQPTKDVNGQKNMFLIMKSMDDHFLGCPLKKDNNSHSYNVIKKSAYPVKCDSVVSTSIYRIQNSDVVHSNAFKISAKDFNNIRKNIYKLFLLGHTQGLKEYVQAYIQDYMNEFRPKADDVVSYFVGNGEYKYYYVYEDNDDYYSLVRVEKNDINFFTVISDEEMIMNKNVPFFDCYKKHNLSKDAVDKYLFGLKKKKIGKI